MNDRYKPLEQLGSGTCSNVLKCIDNTTGATVVIKKVRMEDDGIPAAALRAISFLQDIQHEHVARLLDVIPGEKRILMVLEYMEHDLRTLLHRRAMPFVGRKLKCLVYQLLDGLRACHAHGIVHRDLKPGHLLLSRDESVLKLTDFDMARAFGTSLRTFTHEVVTLWYRAPELLLGEEYYLPAVDLWSAGCIMAELATGLPLFRGDSEIDELFSIFRLLGTPDERSWPGVTTLQDFKLSFPKWEAPDWRSELPCFDDVGLDLLAGLLRYNPNERLTAAQALAHPWFDDVRDRPTDVGEAEFVSSDQPPPEQPVGVATAPQH